MNALFHSKGQSLQIPCPFSNLTAITKAIHMSTMSAKNLT